MFHRHGNHDEDPNIPTSQLRQNKLENLGWNMMHSNLLALNPWIRVYIYIYIYMICPCLTSYILGLFFDFFLFKLGQIPNVCCFMSTENLDQIADCWKLIRRLFAIFIISKFSVGFIIVFFIIILLFFLFFFLLFFFFFLLLLSSSALRGDVLLLVASRLEHSKMTLVHDLPIPGNLLSIFAQVGVKKE